MNIVEGISYLSTLATTAFWIWVLVDCLTKVRSDGNDKISWALVIIFTMLPGALIYFVVQRPKNINGG